MYPTLLQQFVKEECSSYVRNLIRLAIEELQRKEGPSTKRFEFNRFEVLLDSATDCVVLEDVLDPSEAGSQTYSMAEFVAAVE